MNEKTPEQLIDEQRRDIMAFAYEDTDHKFYTINEHGERVEAKLGTVLPDGTVVGRLLPEYQKVADSVTRLMSLYSKTLALNPKDRGILSSLFKGTSQAADGLSEAGKKFYEEAKKTAGINFSIPGSGIFNAAGDMIDAVKSPFTIAGEIIGASKDEINQWGGGALSEKAASSIGIAYASAAQVAASSHDHFQFSDSWHYIMAAIKFAFSKVCDIIGIDKTHEWGWHKTEDWSAFKADEFRESDNEHIEHEMGKLPEIGGLDTDKLTVLTRGGTIKKTDGTQTTVTAANNTSTTPGADDSKVPAPTEHFTKTKKLLSEHPYLTGAGTLVGGVAAYQTGKGAIKSVVRGYAQEMVGENSGLMQHAQDVGNEGLKVRVGKPGGVKILGKETGLLAKERDAVKGSELIQKANEIKSLADERALANPKLVSMATEAREFATPWSKIRHPIDYALQSTGKGIAKMVDIKTPVTGLAKINPFYMPKTAVRNGIKSVDALKEGYHAVDATTAVADHAAAPVVEKTVAAAAKKVVEKPSWWSRAGSWCADAFGFGGSAKAAGEGAEAISTISKVGTGLKIARVGAVGLDFVVPVVSTVSLIHGYKTNDKREIKKSWWEIGTIGTFTAGGAALGLCGGPFAPITCTAGALGGLLVGGIASIFTGKVAADSYDNSLKEKSGAADMNEAQAQPKLPNHDEHNALMALQQKAIEAQQRAIAHAQNAAKGVTAMNVTKVQVGAVGNHPQNLQAVAQTNGLTPMLRT